MRIYFELTTGRLIKQPRLYDVIDQFAFKRADAATLEVQFLTDGVPALLTGAPDIRFAIKETYSDDPVVFTSDFTAPGDASGFYTASPNFNTTELLELFESGDAYVDLLGELTFSTDATSWTSSPTIPSRVYNDVIKGDEGIPTSGSPAYPPAQDVQNSVDAYESLTSGRVILIQSPSGFGFTDYGFNIYFNTGTSFFKTDLDITSFKHAPDNTYYVATTGDDDAGDGSEGNPWRSMSKAVTESSSAGDAYATISVSAGVYSRDYNIGVISVSDPVLDIECSDEAPAIMATSEELEWSSYSGNAYVATNSATSFGCVDLADLDDYGIPRRLTKETSAANVVANAGSYYRTGSTTYVHRTDGSEPTNDEVLVLTIDDGARFLGYGAYVSNVHFYGGNYTCNPRLDAATSPFAFDRCRFHTSWTMNAFEATSLNNGKKIYMNQCSAHYGYNDGFNYHAGSAGGLMVELDCWSASNGLNPTLNSLNGTSFHDGIVGIRVGGNHYDAKNRILHDVGSGESWNLGVSCGNATTQSPALDSVAFYCGLAGGTDGMKMWLDTCTSRGGCATDFAVADTCTLYVRNCGIGPYTRVDTETSGVIQSY